MDQMLAGYDERVAAHNRRGGRFAEGIAWTGADLVPLGEATIPMADQGFLHGDMCYDVPGVWDGRFFRLDDHLERLEASCAKLRLRLPMPRQELKELLIKMVQEGGYRDAYVEIIVTRGLEFVRFKRPEEVVNKVYCLATPYIWVQELKAQSKGGAAVVTRTVHRTPPRAVDPTVKNLQWGDLTRAWFEAQDRGAVYPLLPDGDGNVTEGFGYNVFVVKDGVLSSPSLGVLQGITRRTTAEIAERRGWIVRFEQVPIKSLYECDELFMTSTAGGIMPITTLDGTPVGNGSVGPVTQAIWEDYWKLHYNDQYSFEVTY
ncbi:aminotransferase class IV [Paraburkholderia sp. BL27I4N3]|uniref:aminotransferase class IV n=1 Tax=Paraburkholderia sp. BL27I4N3 TaxID=1938805 RepID=UPI001C6DF170|nr:aminotransferase class IV [Paraburkholderia sp. BL27I4N3]